MVDKRFLRFNRVDNRKLGIRLLGYSITTPAKRTMTVNIPFRNGSVDVSSIYSDYPIYEDREIIARFCVITKNKASLKTAYTRILNSFVDIQGRKELQFYDQMGWIYKAEVVESFSFEEFCESAEFEIKFIAEPIRIGVDYEGSRKLWDNFNFEEDILQSTIYEIEANQTVVFDLINVGRVNIPTIVITSGSSSLGVNNVYATPGLEIGEHIDYNFKLENGLNKIRIATGSKGVKAEIVFRKESI